MPTLKTDAQGRIVSDGTREFVWEKNQLVRVKQPGKPDVVYGYMFGRLKTRTLGNVTETYHYSPTTPGMGRFLVQVNGSTVATYDDFDSGLNDLTLNGQPYQVKVLNDGSLVGIFDATGRVQGYAYANSGRLLRVWDQNGNRTSDPPLSRFMFRSQYYDHDTGLICFQLHTWYDPTTGTYLKTGKGASFYTRPKMTYRAQTTRALERQKVLKTRIKWEKAGYFERLGGFYYGVGKGAWTIVKELVLMGVDISGFQLEAYTAFGDYLVGGNGRFHYSHDPFGGFGKALVARMHANRTSNPFLASAKITAGLGYDMAEGIVMLPIEFVEGLAEGDPEKAGEKTAHMAAFALPYAKIPKLRGALGRWIMSDAELDAALSEAFASYAREVAPPAARPTLPAPGAANTGPTVPAPVPRAPAPTARPPSAKYPLVRVKDMPTSADYIMRGLPLPPKSLPALTAEYLSKLFLRAEQLHRTLPASRGAKTGGKFIAGNQSVTAVLDTCEGYRIVARGGSDISAGQLYMTEAGEIVARLPGMDAEVTAVVTAQSLGLTPRALAIAGGSGNALSICHVCWSFLEGTGATIVEWATIFPGRTGRVGSPYSRFALW